MQALFYTDLASKKVTESLKGSAFKFPTLTYGEDINLGLRFAQKANGKPVEVSRTIDELRATIGRIDARPESGNFQIKVGPIADPDVVGTNITVDIAHNAKAAAVAAALNTLTIVGTTYGTATVEDKSGSWLVIFDGETAAVEVTAYSSSLFPMSFLRTRASDLNGDYIHDVRLIQAPIAMTDQSARVVPPPPSISTLIDGGTNGTTTWPEVQKLFIPPTFRGVYQIRKGFAKTGMLDRTDGEKEILAAMNEFLAEDGESFGVTLPSDNTFHISFDDDLTGVDQSPLDIEVFDAPEGDLTFTLSLDTPELHALLRNREKVTLPLTIEADIQDVNDALVSYDTQLVNTTVTIERELHYTELSTVRTVDYARPPLPKNYVPFNVGQTSNGQLHWAESVGDAIATVFTIDHLLTTDRVDVIIHANAAAGAPLVYGTDYTYSRTNSDSLDVTFAVAPTSNQYLITVLGLEETSFFDAHTHAIGEITGLQTILDDLGTRVTTLETNAGNGAVSTRVFSGTIMQWALPDVLEVWPLRGEQPQPDIQTLRDIDLSLYPEKRRAGGMLPAIHDAVDEALPIPVPTPADSYKDRLFENQTGGDVELYGGRGHRGYTLADGEFAACDGHQWYQVTNYGSLTSYYPVLFDRTLFEIAVNESQLRLATELFIDFSLELATLNSRTAAQWVVVIELGTAPQDTTPATTDLNLKNIVWDIDNPALSQRIVVTHVSGAHRIGFQVIRDENDVVTANQLKYGASTVADTIPADGNFAIRARLTRFDTENSVSDARGMVAINGMAAELTTTDDENTTLGRAVIS